MCGIVGYVGHRVARQVLVDGLKRLEYRGYDSAGIATLEENDFRIVRSKGKLALLESKLEMQSFSGGVGIGHTRWATHGKPDEINAHPHHSKDVILVHNGIIENYRELKNDLVNKGREIVSETDTEVICHVLQDNIDAGLKFFDALLKTISQLRGAFALVILHRQEPQKLYAVRSGSPLVMGKGEGENLLASDIPALLPYTNRVTFMHDGEIAELENNKHTFYNFKGESVVKEFQTVTWSLSQAEKSGYKHFMIKEIHEQPRVVGDTLSGYVDRETQRVTFDNETMEVLKSFGENDKGRLIIVGCGTSWHAGMVARYWIEKQARLPVSVELASELRYRDAVLDKDTLIIAISQSGETADTLAAIREAKRLGCKVIAVCNVLASTLAREADGILYTLAGPEIGVASTKAFTTQMVLLYLISLTLANLRGYLSTKLMAQAVQELIELPAVMKAYLRANEKVLSWVPHFENVSSCYYLGRGMQFPVALEASLKLKEISYIHAEGFAAGEMKHGPIALIEEGTRVVVIAMHDELHEKIISNIQEIKARGAKVYAITDSVNESLETACESVIVLPSVSQALKPFMSILPLQLLSYYVADAKNLDVDQPRNLAKSVTVE